MAVVTQIQLRRGTASQWTSANPVLAAGEMGVETDTVKAKIGDGINAWNLLPYFGGDVSTNAVQTLTNKTISADNNTISGIAASSFVITNASGNIDGSAAQVAIPSGTVVGTSDTQTLTNKTISGANNTLSNIGNSSLTNSAITINGTSVSLGGSISVGDIEGVSAGTGLSGGGTTGSVTLSIDTAVTADLSTAQTLTNKTINGSNNTITNVSLTTGVTGTLPAANGGTGITSLGSGVATFLGTPSSANLAAAVTDETGSGALVFGTSPTISGGTFSDAVIRQPLATPSFSANAYTLALGDQGDILLASNGATAGTINIPTNASVAFPIGTQITVIQTGSGQITISATTPATTTIASTGATSTAPKLRVQNSSATCIKTGTDTWYVVGDIS